MVKKSKSVVAHHFCSSTNLSKIIVVPPGFKPLLEEITKSVLRKQPKDIYRFLGNYADGLVRNSRNGELSSVIMQALTDFNQEARDQRNIQVSNPQDPISQSRGQMPQNDQNSQPGYGPNNQLLHSGYSNVPTNYAASKSAIQIPQNGQQPQQSFGPNDPSFNPSSSNASPFANSMQMPPNGQQSQRGYGPNGQPFNSGSSNAPPFANSIQMPPNSQQGFSSTNQPLHSGYSNMPNNNSRPSSMAQSQHGIPIPFEQDQMRPKTSSQPRGHVNWQNESQSQGFGPNSRNLHSGHSYVPTIQPSCTEPGVILYPNPTGAGPASVTPSQLMPGLVVEPSYSRQGEDQGFYQQSPNGQRPIGQTQSQNFDPSQQSEGLFGRAQSQQSQGPFGSTQSQQGGQFGQPNQQSQGSFIPGQSQQRGQFDPNQSQQRGQFGPNQSQQGQVAFGPSQSQKGGQFGHPSQQGQGQFGPVQSQQGRHFNPGQIFEARSQQGQGEFPINLKQPNESDQKPTHMICVPIYIQLGDPNDPSQSTTSFFNQNPRCKDIIEKMQKCDIPEDPKLTAIQQAKYKKCIDEKSKREEDCKGLKIPRVNEGILRLNKSEDVQSYVNGVLNTAQGLMKKSIDAYRQSGDSNAETEDLLSNTVGLLTAVKDRAALDCDEIDQLVTITEALLGHVRNQIKKHELNSGDPLIIEALKISEESLLIAHGLTFNIKCSLKDGEIMPDGTLFRDPNNRGGNSTNAGIGPKNPDGTYGVNPNNPGGNFMNPDGSFGSNPNYPNGSGNQDGNFRNPDGTFGPNPNNSGGNYMNTDGTYGVNPNNPSGNNPGGNYMSPDRSYGPNPNNPAGSFMNPDGSYGPNPNDPNGSFRNPDGSYGPNPNGDNFRNPDGSYGPNPNNPNGTFMNPGIYEQNQNGPRGIMNKDGTFRPYPNNPGGNFMNPDGTFEPKDKNPDGSVMNADGTSGSNSNNPDGSVSNNTDGNGVNSGEKELDFTNGKSNNADGSVSSNADGTVSNSADESVSNNADGSVSNNADGKPINSGAKELEFANGESNNADGSANESTIPGVIRLADADGSQGNGGAPRMGAGLLSFNQQRLAAHGQAARFNGFMGNQFDSIKRLLTGDFSLGDSNGKVMYATVALCVGVAVGCFFCKVNKDGCCVRQVSTTALCRCAEICGCNNK